MAGSKSAEEALSDLQESMGPELGQLFHLLGEELTWTCWRWSEFVELFAKKESRLEILNLSAPFFFYVVQQTLWQDTLLAISRLAGPYTTGPHPNLAIRRMLPLISDADLQSEVSDRIQAMDGACGFVTPWRNKHIAHRDLGHATGKAASPLPPVTKEKIDKAIDSMIEVLNHVQGACQRSTTAYRFGPVAEGAESLLFTLRDGILLEKRRMARLEAGEYDPEDWSEGRSAV